MWTLLDARNRLSDRLGEEGTTFWLDEERDDAINDAVRFIAGLTNGVPLTTEGEVSSSTPYLDIAGNITGMHGSSGHVVDGGSLNIVSITEADLRFPSWRTTIGTPRWLIIDMAESRAYVAPTPFVDTEISVTVSVIPDEVSSDTDVLFDGNGAMVKYLGPTLNVAASLLLLKERFDSEAERFFGLAMQELQLLGVDPTRLPPLRTVANANGG